MRVPGYRPVCTAELGKTGPNLPHRAHSPKGRKRLTVLLAAQQICLFAKQSATYKGRPATKVIVFQCPCGA